MTVLFYCNSNGRTIYIDRDSQTVVVRDPNTADGGTAFRPDDFDDYIKTQVTGNTSPTEGTPQSHFPVKGLGDSDSSTPEGGSSQTESAEVITNPVDENTTFSRVMPLEFAEEFANGNGSIGPPDKHNEVFIGAAEDLVDVNTAQGAQNRLTLPNASSDAVVEFKLNDLGESGFRSPIETHPPRGDGFQHGGTTQGGAREWNINNGTADDVGATDIKVRPFRSENYGVDGNGE